MMLRRALAASLLLLGGCLLSENAVVYDPGDFAPMPGVEAGATGEQVLKSLGNPNARATGWWSAANRFDQEYVVWYYKEKGRVIFDGPKSLTVVTTEADAGEDGRP